jgi:hypothetical protein
MNYLGQDVIESLGLSMDESPILDYRDPGSDRLTKDELIELESLINRWILPMNEADIEVLNSYMCSDKIHKFDFVIEMYVELILPHVDELGILDKTEHSEELLTSGLYCFLGIFFFRYSQYGYSIETIKDEMSHLFNFVLLYLHVDHYLDDPKVKESERTKTLALMIELLHKPDISKAPNKMTGLVKAYINLLNRSPDAKNILIKLFMSEVLGLLYQRSDKKSRFDYLTIAEIKGGRVGSAIQACLGLSFDKSHYEIGACVQLLDDMIDVYSDQDNQINTTATYDLKHYGHLDHLVLYTARRIDNLDVRFTIFKIFFMENLTYAISHGQAFSRTLRRRLKSYVHLRYCNGTKMMEIVNEWIRQRIMAKIPHFWRENSE